MKRVVAKLCLTSVGWLCAGGIVQGSDFEIDPGTLLAEIDNGTFGSIYNAFTGDDDLLIARIAGTFPNFCVPERVEFNRENNTTLVNNPFPFNAQVAFQGAGSEVGFNIDPAALALAPTTISNVVAFDFNFDGATTTNYVLLDIDGDGAVESIDLFDINGAGTVEGLDSDGNGSIDILDVNGNGVTMITVLVVDDTADPPTETEQTIPEPVDNTCDGGAINSLRSNFVVSPADFRLLQNCRNEENYNIRINSLIAGDFITLDERPFDFNGDGINDLYALADLNNDGAGDAIDINANGSINSLDVNGDGFINAIDLDEDGNFSQDIGSASLLSPPIEICNIFPSLPSCICRQDFLTDGTFTRDIVAIDPDCGCDLNLANNTNPFDFALTCDAPNRLVDTDGDGVVDTVTFPDTLPLSNILIATFNDRNNCPEVVTDYLLEVDLGELTPGLYQIDVVHRYRFGLEALVPTSQLLLVSPEREILSGFTAGVELQRVICRNMNTGQTVDFAASGDSWDCMAHGLDVQPGEMVLQTLIGPAKP
ncbi:MAG: hypothetical protein ACFCBW_21315 [Candidatus Competibacterales bacterium]